MCKDLLVNIINCIVWAWIDAQLNNKQNIYRPVSIKERGWCENVNKGLHLYTPEFIRVLKVFLIDST